MLHDGLLLLLLYLLGSHLAHGDGVRILHAASHGLTSHLRRHTAHLSRHVLSTHAGGVAH